MSRRLIDIVWVGVLAVVMLGVFAYCSLRSSAPIVAEADASATAAGLARASAAHEICYGWQLLDADTLVSAGSNLGAGVKVTDSADRCPRFVEVHGVYHDYRDNSSVEDYAEYTIVTNIKGESQPDPEGFQRLGFGPAGLLTSPGATMLGAARVLPLLAVEAGFAHGAVPEASPSGSPLPLPSAGSDFLRDRWVLLLISGSLLLGAALTLGLAVLLRRVFGPSLLEPEPEPAPVAAGKKRRRRQSLPRI